MSNSNHAYGKKLTRQRFGSTPVARLRSTCGVITTILEVNEAVVHIVRNLNVSLVVIGDHKTNHSEWDAFQSEHTNVVLYLSPDAQNGLPFRTLRHVPWNHFGRKSIGFLYAIAGGCEHIYDFDDDNHLKKPDGFDGVSSWEVFELRAKSGALHVFNPYPYFQPTNDTFIWPRGFPLQFIRDERTYEVNSESLELKVADDVEFDSIAVIQSLADHDPDVDAIYRMTRPLPISFQRQKSILIPPRAVYSPWNAQAVLVSNPAFFGLLLPVSVTGRVSDIWRSYITTRLLWETRYRIGFSSSFVTQYRNPHSYMVDFADEDDLYNRVDELLQALASWTSHGHETLETAYIDLVTKLVKEAAILGEADLQLAKAWVDDLKTIGYVWPTIHERVPSAELSTAAIVDQRHLSVSDETNDASLQVEPVKSAVIKLNTSEPPSSEKRYSVGAFVVTRNDAYGGNLLERSTIALTRMISVLDELIIVDMNTRNGIPFVMLLPDVIKTSTKLKSIVISPDKCAKELGAPCADKLYEALGRNIGLRESSTDIIISTNPEIIFPSRFTIDKIIEIGLPDPKTRAVILPRRDVSADEGASIAQSTEDHENVEISLKKQVNDFPTGPVGLMDVSIITNCGDFQLAHRKLWELSGGFAMKHGHNFGDTNMIARWLSSGATVYLMNTTVFHIQHQGRQLDPASWNPQPGFRVVETDGVKRLTSTWDDVK